VWGIFGSGLSPPFCADSFDIVEASGGVEMLDFCRSYRRWNICALSLFIAATIVACDGSKNGKQQAQTSTVPVAILGIAIDESLALPQCRRSDLELIDGGAAWQALYKGSTTCYVAITLSEKEESEMAKTVDPAFRDRREYRVYTSAASTPSYIKRIILSTLHNKVAEIVIDTTGTDEQNSVFADLKAKFGSPSGNGSNQGDFGAQSINASWLIRPQNIAVNFEGFGGDPDTGHITLDSQSFRDAESEYSARHPSPHL
jgi:hypothetical protein